MLSYFRLKLITAVFLASSLFASPVEAQSLKIQDILRNTPSSRVKFSPYTVGVVIRGGGDIVYKLNLQKGQNLEVNVDSTGLRAAVFVFDKSGKELKVLTDEPERNNFNYKVPSSGDYYIYCYSGGPAAYTYSLTVVAQ